MSFKILMRNNSVLALATAQSHEKGQRLFFVFRCFQYFQFPHFLKDGRKPVFNEMQETKVMSHPWFCGSCYYGNCFKHRWSASTKQNKLGRCSF